ncbi:MAG: hypothetical protein WD470_05020 [Rhodospirillaceae bacterium]
MRNAVDTAITSFRALRREHEHTMLFHARFAMCDRQTIEQDVLARFGRDAGPECRAGRILVATQVVEQSLDLDFDLVISDLAPIDLLIQRAGRLWRHMDRRPELVRPIAGPNLCVISPEASEATHEKWLEPVLGPGAFTYKHPGIMWRTAAAVFEAGTIRTPDDLRPFIERVYGHDDVPECLRKGQDRAEGRGYGERYQAGQNLIDFTRGYPNVGSLDIDQEIGTRLGEETVCLRLARQKGAELVPWALHALDDKQLIVECSLSEAQLWALSEISVRVSWLGRVLPPPSLARAVANTKTVWPQWEQDRILIGVVQREGRVALSTEKSSMHYSMQSGLTKVIISP